MQYIVLNEDKTPAEKLSDGGHNLSEVKEFDNLGVLVPEPYIILDFDTTSDAEIMLRIVQELEIKCMVMKTTRGYHFWFKSSDPWKNFKKTRLAIGIYSDCRSYGKLSYVVVKKDGEWREWIKTFKADEIEEVPIWLKPLSCKYSFKGLKSGDGRNQDLFEYILVMQSKGYTQEQIAKTIDIINRFVFDEPLPENEIKTIIRDDSFKQINEITFENTFFDEDGKFKHNVFATALISDMQIVTVNEQCFVYKNGYYQSAEKLIEQRMIELYKTIKRNQRFEVIDYIKILTHKSKTELNYDEFIINLNNARLNVKTGTTLPFDPTILDFCRIPITYDPTAICVAVDKMLNKVFKCDNEVIDLFEEMLGYCLIRNCRYRKGFLFYGGGSNGKSTVLNMIKRFIGEENCATIEMEKLYDRFKTAELEHKLINIGDDLNKREITDTGTIKKLFTGESMTVERKGQDPFTLKNYAKMIFSANEIPRIADKTHGMYSRLMLIPFTAVFSPLDEDFDPYIEDKVTTDEAMSYLLNRALRGLRRLFRNNGFTQPQAVTTALDTYKTDNSTVLTWINECSIEVKELLADTTDKLFSEFKDWCNRSDIKFGASIKTFHKDIEERYNLVRVRSRSRVDNLYKWKFTVNLGS